MPDTNLNFTESVNPALTVKIVGFSSPSAGAELTITLNTLLNIVRGNVKIDDLVQGDDNTDLNASVTRHGLLRKLDNDTTHFLRGDGQWAVPPGGGGGAGADGNDGWSPVFGVVTDGARRVLQIVSWAGGEGSPPSSTNIFLGASGFVSSAAAAVDIRGATGASGSGSGDVLLTAAQTLTNKRITKRVLATTTTATLTPDIDAYDAFKLTAQAGNLSIANPTGTPTDEQVFQVLVRASGANRQITHSGSKFSIPSGSTFASPYTLTSGTAIRLAYIYDAASDKYQILTAIPGLV